MDRYENTSQLDHFSTHRQVDLYEDPSIIKQPAMALQQGHSPARPLDSYKDTSQVALYEDPNSIRFAKTPSQLVLFSLQNCDYTYRCQTQQTLDDAHDDHHRASLYVSMAA